MRGIMSVSRALSHRTFNPAILIVVLIAPIVNFRRFSVISLGGFYGRHPNLVFSRGWRDREYATEGYICVDTEAETRTNK